MDDVSKLLASIDPTLLEPLNDDINESHDDVDEDGFNQEEEGEIDPELLAELNRLAGVSSEKEVESNVSELESQFNDNELEGDVDPELLKELYFLAGVPLPNQESNELEKKYKARQFELKKLALDFKKQGDLIMAKKIMSESRKIDEKLINKDLKMEEFEPLPKLNEIKIIEEEIKIIKPVLTLASISDEFDSLLQRLDLQIQQASNLARTFYKYGDKPSALRFQRYKKSFEQQLKNILNRKQALLKLKTLPSNINDLIPKLKEESISYNIPNNNMDIPPNNLQLTILKGMDLSHPNQPNLNTYVSYSFPHPIKSINGYTDTINNSCDPNYKYQTHFYVENSKQMKRIFEKKTLSLEVFHYYNWFYGKISLGKIEINLKDLIKESLTEKVYELTNPINPRQLTGGKLKVRLAMRYPLEVKNNIKKVNLTWGILTSELNDLDIINEDHQIDNLNKKETLNTQLPEPIKIVHQSNQTISSNQSNQTISPNQLNQIIPEQLNQSIPSQSQSQSQPNSQSISSSSNNISTSIPIQFNISFSKPLLEYELNLIKDPIQQLQLETSLQVLMTSIETQQLSIDQYIKNNVKGYNELKLLAVKFNKEGDKEKAKELMRKCRIVKNELDEVKEMKVVEDDLFYGL